MHATWTPFPLKSIKNGNTRDKHEIHINVLEIGRDKGREGQAEKSDKTRVSLEERKGRVSG